MHDLVLKPHLCKRLNLILRILAVFIILLLMQIGTTTASSNEKINENIKSYIQNIKSVAISFEQHDEKGAKALGILIIDKPYKFRVNYFRPFPLTIVGNQNYVSVYDNDMETLSRISAGDNIFNFLLVDQVNFDNQFKILESKETKGHYRVKLIHLDSDKISEIEFNAQTKNIEAMKIIEDSNTIDLRFGQTIVLSKVNKGLFILQDPDIFGKPKYFNEQALQKEYEVLKK